MPPASPCTQKKKPVDPVQAELSTVVDVKAKVAALAHSINVEDFYKDDLLYFDHYQADPADEPLAIGGRTTLEDVYTGRLLPKKMSADQERLVMGLQAQLWTEYLPDAGAVQYMAFPRLCACAVASAQPQQTHRLTKEMKKKGHAFFSGKVGYFPVSKLSSIIIKHEEDFLLAKMIIEGSKKNNSAVEYYEKEKFINDFKKN